MRPRRLALTGQRFGRWLVIKKAEPLMLQSKQSHWLCRCDCGIERVCQATSLRNGRSQSCGCRAAELAADRFRTHGDTVNRKDSKEWRAWKDAKARCHNTKHHWFKGYGAKGVTMCPAWRTDYPAFLRDMGRAPTPDHSLDRINPAGNYEPGNCRWATRQEQRQNQRPPSRRTGNTRGRSGVVQSESHERGTTVRLADG